MDIKKTFVSHQKNIMAQSEINIEMRTTWVLLAMKLCNWLKSKWLLKLLDGAILFRTYENGKLLSEFRFNIEEL